MELTELQLRDELRQIVNKNGKPDTAKHLGVSIRYISMILRGDREITATIAERLGYTMKKATHKVFSKK